MSNHENYVFGLLENPNTGIKNNNASTVKKLKTKGQIALEESIKKTLKK